MTQPHRDAVQKHRGNVTKARLLGLAEPQSKPAGEALFGMAFTAAGGIEPPYDPQYILGMWFELSAALRPNVDAYAANIDGYGHRFVPAIDLDAEDADARIAETLFMRKLAQAGGLSVVADDADMEPTPEEVQVEKAALRRLARREHSILESFFRHCCAESSFVRLRRRKRQDEEVTGNAYWEVLRNLRGEPARFVYVASYLCRLLPLDQLATDVTEFEMISPVDYERTLVRRRLRRFVQLDETTQQATYFKEFGDRRVMSSATGRYYQTAELLTQAEPHARAATELLHFKIDFPNTPYGMPRWIGALPEVAGSRAAAEVNYLIFDNKSVPPLAVLISGGKLAAGADKRIEDYIEENLKGRRNFHKMLLIEAESDGKSRTAARVEIVPLNGAMQRDALFQNYDERNIDKIGAQFRLPRLLRGDTRDFNRATSEAALRLAEEQVFGPEREDFDWVINQKLLPAMGIRFWRFRSLTPITKDPERLGKLIALLVTAGILLPKEARALAVDVFNVELPTLKEPWVSRPVAFTLAGIQTGGEVDEGMTAAPEAPGAAGAAGNDHLIRQARNLMGLAKRLEAEESELAARRTKMAREMFTGEADEVLQVPAAEFRSWLADD